MRKYAKIFLAAALLSSLAAAPAHAHGGDGGYHHQRVVKHVEHHHYHRWPAHNHHRIYARPGNRIGWWWTAGDGWVYYPAYPAAVYGYRVEPVPVVYNPTPVFGFSFDLR